MKGFLVGDGLKGKTDNNKYDGINNGKWSFPAHHKISAQGLFYLMKSVGWKDIRVNINEKKDDTYYIRNATH